MSAMTRSAHGLSTPCVDEWWEAAWCSGMDQDVFFTESNRSLALHYCQVHCPVVRQCNQEALRVRPAYAVQGGVAFNATGSPFGYPVAPLRTCRYCGGLPDDERCGTLAGYRRHRRLDEGTCGPCRSAHAMDRARRRSSGRAVLLGKEGP